MNCRACGSQHVEMVERISYDVIWASYDDVLGVRFSDSIRSSHSPAEFTVLHECQRCLIQYFDPATPGNPEFYAELSRAPSVPYHDDRWEFTVVAQQLSAGQNVLDIGAGPGWFLDIALSKGCITSAVETNPVAIASLAERGIDAYASIETFIESQVQPIDAVTAFHLVEHVADVGNLFERAKVIIRPGGSLFVSVPNRARSGRKDLEPLDVPPHHLTRWSPDVLRTLAQIHGLRLEAIMYEPPDIPGARQGARKGVYRRLKPLVPKHLAYVLARVAGRIVSRDPTYTLLTRASGFRHLGLYGHSILAHYRTVASEGQS